MGAEGHLLRLIATDRIEIPISSASGRLKRQKKPIALDAAAEFNMRYNGQRTYARIVERDKMKARTMSEGIDEFEARYPKYGAILRDIIGSFVISPKSGSVICGSAGMQALKASNKAAKLTINFRVIFETPFYRSV